MNFENIEYLQFGNSRQKRAYSILDSNNIFSILEPYDPILVGTIPINIDIENSDLDIICYFQDKQEFQKTILNNFGKQKNFTIRENLQINPFAVVSNFLIDDFEIEIFGQSIPTKQQFAYRHLIVEHNLLNKYGETFRQKIIKLKQQGHKTEPAFGLALDLTGDPYTELLKFEVIEKSPNR